MSIPDEVRQFLKEAGRAGGQSTKAKLGPEHYKRISALGVAKRRSKKVAKSS